MALNHFKDVANFITGILITNGNDFNAAPHKDFWNTMTYSQFTTGNVPDLLGPGLRILIPGDSQNSTLIQALRGEGRFDGGPGNFSRMPADSDGQALPQGTPYFTPDQIKQIADWIDATPPCPE